MAFAIPSRTKILSVIETLAIGTAGGALFLLLNLPGGLISGAMIAVGGAAIAGRPLTVPPIANAYGASLPGAGASSRAISGRATTDRSPAIARVNDSGGAASGTIRQSL